MDQPHPCWLCSHSMLRRDEVMQVYQGNHVGMYNKLFRNAPILVSGLLGMPKVVSGSETRNTKPQSWQADLESEKPLTTHTTLHLAL